MTRSSIIAAVLTFALAGTPVAFAQTEPGQSNGSAPQAGVGGPADGAKNGTNDMTGAKGAPTAADAAGKSKGTRTGGNSGGAADKN